MNRTEYIDKIAENYARAVEISRAKSSDYAADSDPFRNFRGCEQHGVTAEQGILVRMSDKMSRIGNLLQQEAQVKDESIGDTLLDLANYAVILKLLIESRAQ